MSENDMQKTSQSPESEEALERLAQLVPDDQVSRKRILASLLRALNLEGRN